MQDATAEYEPIHPPGTIEKHLSKDKHLGAIEQIPGQKQTDVKSNASDETKQAPLSVLQNLNDFETEAKKHLSKKAWIYYSSAAESLSSHANNVRDWGLISLRPRVLRDVSSVSMRCNVMGHESSLPFFIAPAALAKLGHQDGELCLARGAARWNIPYCCSTYSSIAHADLASCLMEERKGGVLFFQLYVPIVKHEARKLIREARRLNYKALVVTVDSAVIGKREEDDRYKAELDHAAGVEIPPRQQGNPPPDAPILRGAHSSSFEWDDLVWIRKEWNDAGPIVLKGIQTVEDAIAASKAGIHGIYLSNHGGRQLDHAPSSLVTLLEIRKHAPELISKMDIYVDGGIRRGTDVLKALCLGARAVALGRPFMYSLSGYGTDGVCKAIEILSDEIETAMRLMGVTDLSQLNDYCVNSSALESQLSRRVDLAGTRISRI